MDWSWIRDLMGVLFGWVLGIMSALMARGYDERKAARDTRLALIHRIRVRLSIIYAEVENRTGFYFTKNTADRILEELRHDVYSLLDEPLIEELENGTVDIRSLGVHGGDASRNAAKPHLVNMLTRLYDLATALENRPSLMRRLWPWKRRTDPFRVQVR